MAELDGSACVTGEADLLLKLFEYGVRGCGMPVEKLARLASVNVAAAYGIDGCKHGLALGADADVVVFDADAPGTGLPSASSTRTTGVALQGCPFCTVFGGWVVITSFVATPGVRSIAPDVTSVRPVDRNVRVYEPTVPVMPRFVNVAMPDALVDADVVPVNVAPPPVISAVTVTPATSTGLFVALSSLTAGCVAKV